MGMRKYDIRDFSGKTFNSWTISGRTKIFHGKAQDTLYWEFVCECGESKWCDPSSFFRKNYRACKECHKKSLGVRGASHFRYKGTKDIPHRYFSALKQGAVARGLIFDISIDDIQEQLEEQNFLCVYTGTRLVFGNSVELGNASVDRINSQVGYVRGNIQIIDKKVNIMKWDMDEEEFLSLCKIITEHVSRDRGSSTWQ